MGRVDPEKFLTELNRLFERNKARGSVFITLKRTNEKPRRGKGDYSHLEYKCLVRATDGRRKVSAALTGRELARFRDSYATILRAHADALKRRVRARREASPAKGDAK